MLIILNPTVTDDGNKKERACSQTHVKCEVSFYLSCVCVCVCVCGSFRVHSVVPPPGRREKQVDSFVHSRAKAVSSRVMLSQKAWGLSNFFCCSLWTVCYCFIIFSLTLPIIPIVYRLPHLKRIHWVLPSFLPWSKVETEKMVLVHTHIHTLYCSIDSMCLANKIWTGERTADYCCTWCSNRIL